MESQVKMENAKRREDCGETLRTKNCFKKKLANGVAVASRGIFEIICEKLI